MQNKLVHVYRIRRKHNIRLLVILLLVILFVLGGYIFFRHQRISNGITAAEAAKMLAYASAQSSELVDSDGEGYWYEKYIEYVNENHILNIADADQYVSYEDLTDMIDLYHADKTQFQDILSSNGYIRKDDFINFYLRMLAYMPYGSNVKQLDAIVAGTPGTLTNAGEWQVYTTEGIFKFTGMMMDDKVDKNVSFIVSGDEILCICSVVSDQITYQNVWIKSSSDTTIDFNIYGIDRSFTVNGISEDVSSVLTDISLQGGKVKNVNIKTDTISGKILSVTEDYVEIEGYGKVALDQYFMIYDINDGVQVKTYQDIVVGYSLQDFIVANGKICGAVISKPLKVENIRVILKTSGFSSIFHSSVTFTCDTPFNIVCGDVVEQHEPGEVILYDTGSELLAEGRVTVEPQDGGKIQLLSVERSQGYPAYEGKIEFSVYDGGIVVVNEVDIESYLKSVVPSEMPASFGVEALKVQAICARSYAYKQLTNSYYSMYGAHADDSTLFQVYNNTVEHEESNEAIKQTKAQVLTYNGNVIETYYYSTSCGTTTDISLWGSDPSEYPYFVNRDVSRVARNLDLSDESTFEQFILSKDENDYDSGCALYRWEYDLDCTEMNRNFNSKLHEKYLAVPTKVLTQNANGEFVSRDISSVGYVNSIIVNSRTSGGAATSVTVVGSDATVQINSESVIRSLFGDSNVEMTTNTGTTKMASMPSTFCIFRPLYDGDRLVGFRITGGGYGHGIGMSQNAVNTMVKEGMTYDQVLQFFYPNTIVKTMTSGS